MDEPPQQKDLPSKIDSPENLKQFYDEIRERAKQLSPSCIENTHPSVAAKALWMLAQGAKISDIKRVTNLPRQTIRRLEWAHNDTLETKRKEFSMMYALAAAEFTDLIFMKAEQLHDDPDQLAAISPEKLALTMNILTEQAAKLLGMATTKVEVVKRTSIEDALLEIEKARQRVSEKIRGVAVDAEIIEEQEGSHDVD
jgi:hypothetical protein